ncbi:MAG: amylo-alpha-1,6-glucosidase, partial [Xanthomonadales bacterium]|nr:amylo-alpha-1,6-glucosidase [Xanthomonadales bacterium]
MAHKIDHRVEQAREAAIEVLRSNAHGPYRGLPRTAGWGYPEPYTRDLMISSLGMLTSGDELLRGRVRRVLQVLAENQSERGHMPGLVHDANDRGASDTTPLFLLGVGVFRRATGEEDFLWGAAAKAMTWMDHQSPDDHIMVAQQPTSDWRDEQWVLGYGLYVNVLLYACLRMFGRQERADELGRLLNKLAVQRDTKHSHVHEGLVLPHKPYYAMWSYKLYSSQRFDLLGNSLAVLAGAASRTRARSLISWVERECEALREGGQLALKLPPCMFPYIRPD